MVGISALLLTTSLTSSHRDLHRYLKRRHSGPMVRITLLYLGLLLRVCCYRQRGLRAPPNAIILIVLYVVFCLSTALWALEVAQLIGLVDLLLSPDGLSTDGLFNRFYDLIARETKVTGVLFESQASAIFARSCCPNDCPPNALR